MAVSMEARQKFLFGKNKGAQYNNSAQCYYEMHLRLKPMQ